MSLVLQLYTPTDFLVIHFKKTTEKIEVWLIIVYYDIVLVSILIKLRQSRCLNIDIKKILIKTDHSL